MEYRKTQDALDFVYSNRKSRNIFWIHCGSSVQFDEDYRKLAKLVNIPETNESGSSGDVKRVVKDWLESEESGDWILVLDNADNKLDFFPNTSGNSNAGLARYIPQATKGTVIITTRDYEVALQLAGTKAVLTKKAMQSSDAEALFRHHYPGWVPHDKPDCVQLLRELQHLPLAVVQVASYLEMNRHILTPAQYLKRYRSTKEDERILLSKSVYNSWRSKSASTGSETVLTTFAITFRQIQEQSPLADAILTVIACIDPQGIPYQLLADVEGGNDVILLGEALAKLHNLSLLQVTSTDNINKSYTVHSLVHLAIQHFLSPQDRDTALRKTAHHLMEVLPPNGEFKHWPAWRQYLPHTTVFLHNSQLLTTPEVASICYGTADYLITTGRYRDAQVLAERAVSIRTMVLGEGHSDTLDAIICLANIFRCQGKLKDAERLEAGLLKKWALRFGETHQDTLTSMNNLAITFSFQGRLKEAEELQSKVLEIDRKLRGEKHRDTLTSMNNLATIFFKQGRLREAELLLIKVLKTRTKVLGTNHPDTLSTKSNLALTFNLQGRFKEAEKLEVQLLEISTDQLGKEHPDTLASMNNLAITLRKQGRDKEAEELQVKALEVEKRVLGEEHPDTLTSMNNLATTLSQQDRWSEAEELRLKVLEISTNVLGRNDLNTLTYKNNLAHVLSNQGRWMEAKNLHEEVLEMRTVLLGIKNPDTLQSMNNLAFNLYALGNFDKAIQIMDEVVYLRSQLFGDEDPHTRNSLGTLARWKGKHTSHVDANVMMVSFT